MTGREQGGTAESKPEPRTRGGQDDARADVEFRDRSFFSLLPKRSIVRILTMLLVLAALLMLQRRSGFLVDRITNILLPPAPQQRQKEPPAVRLAPPNASPPRSEKP